MAERYRFFVKIRYVWADFTDLIMDSVSIAVLIGALLTMASVVFGAKYKQGKGKVNQAPKCSLNAAQDDEVTEKESQKNPF